MFFWTKVPEQVEKIIVSTIKYINNLELDSDKKEKRTSVIRYETSLCR